MKFSTKLCASGAALATTVALGIIPATAASAAPSAAPVAAPSAATPRTTVSGAINETIAGVGTFVGNFTPTEFINQGGQLAVVGDLVGTFTNTAGATQTVNQSMTTTVQNAAAAGSCDILNLVLGPLDLDLLGLEVHLDQVVLDIVAQSGAGNLLGNLLCAVAGLLDGNGINGLANLLNRLLGL